MSAKKNCKDIEKVYIIYRGKPPKVYDYYRGSYLLSAFTEKLNLFSHGTIDKCDSRWHRWGGLDNDVIWLHCHWIAGISYRLDAFIYIGCLKCKMPDGTLWKWSLGVGKYFDKTGSRIKHHTSSFPFSPSSDKW